ncbi:hypothetical protein ACTXT7_010479 [Hymenolepis weldensis]
MSNESQSAGTFERLFTFITERIVNPTDGPVADVQVCQVRGHEINADRWSSSGVSDQSSWLIRVKRGIGFRIVAYVTNSSANPKMGVKPPPDL